jgi:hypothetical protein
MSQSNGKPACRATTRAGTPCKAKPLKGHAFCLAHADEKTRESVGFVADNGKAGRKPNPKPIDILREKVEGEIEKWLKPYEEALEATSGIVVGNGASAELAEVPDYRTRLSAAGAVLDRLYCRPKQATELTGADGGPIQTAPLLPDDPEWEARIAAVQAAHVPALNGSSNGNGNGNGSH